MICKKLCFLYSNLHTNMIISPFFKFMIEEFNNKLNILYGEKTKTTDFENKLKRLLVIFRGLFSIWQKLKPTLVNF